MKTSIWKLPDSDSQLGHALSLLQDVTPDETDEAMELEKKLKALGLSSSDDEWVDEED